MGEQRHLAADGCTGWAQSLKEAQHHEEIDRNVSVVQHLLGVGRNDQEVLDQLGVGCND